MFNICQIYKKAKIIKKYSYSAWQLEVTLTIQIHIKNRNTTIYYNINI